MYIHAVLSSQKVTINVNSFSDLFQVFSKVGFSCQFITLMKDSGQKVFNSS